MQRTPDRFGPCVAFFSLGLSFPSGNNRKFQDVYVSCSGSNAKDKFHLLEDCDNPALNKFGLQLFDRLQFGNKRQILKSHLISDKQRRLWSNIQLIIGMVPNLVDLLEHFGELQLFEVILADRQKNSQKTELEKLKFRNLFSFLVCN